MKKYIITIVDLRTGNTTNSIKDENDIDDAVNVLLGGWKNLHCSSTGDDLTKSWQQSGITKDKVRMFSILCYTPQN